jgi:hypothetical protein
MAGESIAHRRPDAGKQDPGFLFSDPLVAADATGLIELDRGGALSGLGADAGDTVLTLNLREL